MMMLDKRLIEQAEHIDLSRCYKKSDRIISQRRIRDIGIAKLSVRAESDSPWLVLKVMTGRELEVGEMLQKADVESLVPMKMGKKLRRRHQEIEPKLEPVFIGYLFARCIISNDTMAALIGFDHVTGILGGYETPHLITNKNVLSFNEKAKKGQFDHEVPQAVFCRGMKVHIREGIFAGSQGEIISGGSEGKGTAVVGVLFLGGLTPVIMPLAILEPLCA